MEKKQQICDLDIIIYSSKQIKCKFIDYTNYAEKTVQLKENITKYNPCIMFDMNEITVG